MAANIAQLFLTQNVSATPSIIFQLFAINMSKQIVFNSYADIYDKKLC